MNSKEASSIYCNNNLKFKQMKTQYLLIIISFLFFASCNEKDGPVIIPPKEKPEYYDLGIRLSDYNACKSITKETDGSYYVDWTDGFDAYFFLDMQLDEEDMAAGVEFAKYNLLEFEVKGASVIDNTPLILFLGGYAWPNFCSDCKNFIPISTDWVKVSCDLMADVPNQAAVAPWSWIRLGIGANAHTPTFYIRNIKLYNPNYQK